MGGGLLIVVIAIGRPAAHLARWWWTDPNELGELPAGVVDDASRMNATRVTEIWDIPPETEAAERQLIELLRRARENGLPVSIAGARHTMGGHTISPDGIVINMLPFNRMELDEKTNVLPRAVAEFRDRAELSAVGLVCMDVGQPDRTSRWMNPRHPCKGDCCVWASIPRRS